MTRLNLLFIILLFSPFVSCGQNLDQLYDLFFDARGLTYINPLTKFDFDRYSFRGLFEEYIDSLRFQQILANSKRPDSTPWNNEEAKNQILVSDNESVLEWKNVKPKYIIINKRDEDWYKAAINNYNKNPRKSLIYRVSRPIFDDKKEYALIQYRYYNDGYGIRLYKIKNGEWKWLFSYE